MVDPLDRFVEAQRGDYDHALSELRAGHKRSHWSWYVFPQLAGLGHSAMSRRYALAGPAEARAFLAHPLLGPRLRECVAAMRTHAGRDAADILGGIDAMKFHACVTLFAHIAEPASPFHAALAEFFGGVGHPQTLSMLPAQA
jgi:uncharacterized protein (DUF1810 family)